MSELPKTKLYRIGTGLARRNKLPVFFVAKKLIETRRAVYLYGRGTTAAQTKFGSCCKCGRELTHPGSILLGIGPVCVNNWGLRDEAIKGKSKEEIDRIVGKIICEQIVDSWVPKSSIKKELDTDEIVEVPEDHPRLENEKGTGKEIQKRAATLINKKYIKITFPFNADDLSRVKTLSGRHYQSKPPRHWTAPLTLASVKKLQEWGFELDEHLKKYLEKTKAVSNKRVEEIAAQVGAAGQGLKKELYPFQKVGVAFAEKRDGRAIIGDEMGIGKTMQALGYLQLHYRTKRPVIIVCPATIKYNWAQEYADWIDAHDRVQILSGRDTTIPLTGNVFIVNYDILSEKTELCKTGRAIFNPKTKQYEPEMKRKPIKETGWGNRLMREHAQVLILDECHYIKNNGALRTKAVKKLAAKIPHTIGLSGTPIQSRPKELDIAIRMIDPTVLPSFWTCAKRYYGANHNGYGWNFDGATNTEEFHELLTGSIMIRRLKADVMPELPPKQRSVLPLELTNRKEYNIAEADFLSWVEGVSGKEAAAKASKAEAFTKIEALKQLTIKGKIAEAMNWISDFLDNGKKLVVFCTHKSTIDHLMKKFGDVAVKIDGSVSAKKRQEVVNEFQGRREINRKRKGTSVKIEYEDIPKNEQPMLFVGNLKAAGIGITLTAADSVVFLELGWTPGEHDQAEDRIHRIGQEAQSINIYYLLAANSIELSIARMIDKKRIVLAAVLDGKVPDDSSMIGEIMADLLAQKKKGKQDE